MVSFNSILVYMFYKKSLSLHDHITLYHVTISSANVYFTMCGRKIFYRINYRKLVHYLGRLLLKISESLGYLLNINRNTLFLSSFFFFLFLSSKENEI